MAAPAEQQTPYIGSKISLISKSEIRYEGILYTVDTKESTIALAQVKSFGTEDRPTDHPFPARDEVFRFIIFKASDIKDLMVCETPKPVPQLVPGLTYDPAIVSVSQQPNAPGAASGVSPGGNRQVAPSGSSSRTDTPSAQHNRASPDQLDGRRGGGRRSPGAQMRGANGRQQQYSNSQYRQQQQYAPRGGNAPGAPMSYRNAALSGAARGRGAAGGVQHMQHMPQQHHGGAPQQMNAGYAGGRGVHMNHHGNYRGVYHQRHPQGGMHHHRGGRGGRGGGTTEKLKFDTEFDFEKANEMFQETRDELSKELKSKLKVSESGEDESDDGKEAASKEPPAEEEADASAEEDQPFYDKSVSFFDNISCEALEKQEGRQNRADWKKERETNTETFGSAALRSYNFRRGGYHRGYGYRGYNHNYRGYHGGGYRGGRGYHHQNNMRHNNNYVSNY